MKKTILVAGMLLLAACSEQANVEPCNSNKPISLYQRMSGSVALTSDTEYQGDKTIGGDLNLNGHTLTVYGKLIVKGNLNGGGTVYYCGLKVNGAIQNNPSLNPIDCNTLSMPETLYNPCE